MKILPDWIKPAVVALALMGIAAILLHRHGPKQKLGPSGVKLVHDALLGGDNLFLRTNGVAMPAHLIGFDSVQLPIQSEELFYLPTDTTFGRRGYRDEVDQFEALLTVVVMGTDRTSLHQPEQCLGSQGVSLVSRETVFLPTSVGRMEILRCNAIRPFSDVNRTGKTRAVFAYFFLAADRQTSSHYRRHLISMRDMILRGETPRWAGIQCFAYCKDGAEDATFNKMKHLLSLALPAMRETGAGPVVESTAKSAY